MRRYNIPFKESGKTIEEIIWKFPFSETIREIRKNSVEGEKIYEIELAPDIIPSLINLPHMIIANGSNRKRFLSNEKIFSDYRKARENYIKEELNIGFADILPILAVNELDTHGKIKIYEAKY
jgi:hypothetical protein